MKHKTSSEFSATEKQFLEALRQHPELQTRFQFILDLTRNVGRKSKNKGVHWGEELLSNGA